MSKNINQYKSAMDNIRMSESFAKRTETLLKEIPENREAVSVGKSSRISLGRIVLTAGTGLAACLLIAAAIRGNVFKDTESTAVTTESQVVITEITTEVVTLETEAVYVEIDDSAVIDDETDEKYRDELDRLEEEVQTSATTTTVQTQKQPAAGEAPHKVNDNTPAPEYENDAMEEVVEEAVEEEANMDGGAPEIGLMSVNPNSRTLYDIDFSNASMEIQSYVNASDAADIKVDSAEKIRELTAFVGDIAYSTPLTQQNKTFISEYVVNISEGGNESFTIYVTDRNSVIITVHYDDNQVRTEYLLSKDKYRDIEKKLYLYFGTETEYEAFISLKSGK